MATPLVLSDASIEIAVDFFDRDEREKLLKYPTREKLLTVVERGVSVPVAQLLTYYLFHKKRPGKPGWSDYHEISEKIGRALEELEDWVEFSNGRIVSAPDAVPQDRAITERLGEAIGLSVINSIHGLHEADWGKIPEHPGPNGFATFDYEIPGPQLASDGVHTIQIEAKGSTVENTEEIGPAVRKQKSKLDQKKSKITKNEIDGDYPHGADVRYGTICAVGRRGPTKCWLVDPPDAQAEGARRRRLLTRMRFLFDWISFLRGRSQLASALATRLRALYALDDPFVLDGIPLVRGDGRNFAESPTLFADGPSLLGGLSRVTDGPTGGTIVQLPNNSLFFLGVRENLFSLAVSQDFEALLRYREQSATVRKQLRCVVTKRRAARMGLERIIEGEEGPYVRFYASGKLQLSRGGLAFGIIKPDA